ncbi:hypothetical protein QO5_2348, partial [Clostridioides difficile F253]
LYEFFINILKKCMQYSKIMLSRLSNIKNKEGKYE